MPALMLAENCAVAVFWAESVTVRLKLAAPAAVGLPLSVPAADNVSPAGRVELLATAQVYPLPVPPVAVSVWEYDEPV